MLARSHALVIAVALAAGSPGAVRAEVLDLPRTLATVTIDDAWAPVPLSEAAQAAGLVVGYRARGDVVLAITRAQVPNTDAWRRKLRDAYVDELERGLAAHVEGYRRTARTVHELGGVPVVDLEARRRDGATLVVRALLFRTYALTLAIEVPRGAGLGAARETRATFTPPVPPRGA